MKLHNMLPFRVALASPLLYAISARAGDGLSQEYCSNQNTGSDYSPVWNQWQSNGACQTQCKDNYAFAIVQYQNCWCSNYIPAVQQDTSSCNQKCPGFPSDLCGNENDGLFGYIALSIAPSGTMGATSGTSTSSSSGSPTSSSELASSTEQPSSSQTPETSTTPTPTPTTLSSSWSPPASTSTTAAAAATTEVPSTSPSPTPTPVTTVQVVTLSGAIVTQTVTSTPLPAPAQDPSNQPIQEKKLSAGAIAGIAIAAVLGLLALVLAAALLWRRKRNQEIAETTGPASPATKGHRSPKRNISVLSKSGLLARQHDMAERDDDTLYPHTGTGQNSVRHSMLFGAGAEGIAPASPLGNASGDGDSRRLSKPLVYDQRLNPSALWAHDNGSRVSIQDNADYSRTLGVVNPDLRHSLDSRVSRG